MKTLGRRLLYVERPDLFSEKECCDYEKAIAKRLLGESGDEPRLTLPLALTAIDELLGPAVGDERELLLEPQAQLIERQSKATAQL